MFTPCRRAGCRNKGLSKYQGYCEKHKQHSGWFNNECTKGNRHQRGYGKDWDKAKNQALLRDDYLCVKCDEVGIVTAATTVDHIIPKVQGGTDDPENLQSLCDVCHKKKTALERLAKQG